MTRLELYHQKAKPYFRKRAFFFILASILLTVGFFVMRHYFIDSIRIEAPEMELGKKVVVQLPNGQKVFTFEKLIIEKNGRTYYKGERNIIDLTGGSVTYEDWK